MCKCEIANAVGENIFYQAASGAGSGLVPVFFRFALRKCFLLVPITGAGSEPAETKAEKPVPVASGAGGVAFTTQWATTKRTRDTLKCRTNWSVWNDCGQIRSRRRRMLLSMF